MVNFTPAGGCEDLMARIRSIKPEFFTSEQLVECSTNARLLFVGLWCFCDDAGRHPASAKRLKMEVFPGDDDITTESVARLVTELSQAGLIIEYESQSRKYWWVTGWEKHQKIDRPTIKFPGPFDEGSTIIRRTLDEHLPPERKGEEGILGLTSLSSGDDGNGKSENRKIGKSISAERFFQQWQKFAASTGLAIPRTLSDGRKKKIATRLKAEGWYEVFLSACGKLPIPNDHNFTWQPDIDWLIDNDTNAAKLAEGRYDKRDTSPKEGFYA